MEKGGEGRRRCSTESDGRSGGGNAAWREGTAVTRHEEGGEEAVTLQGEGRRWGVERVGRGRRCGMEGRGEGGNEREGGQSWSGEGEGGGMAMQRREGCWRNKTPTRSRLRRGWGEAEKAPSGSRLKRARGAARDEGGWQKI